MSVNHSAFIQNSLFHPLVEYTHPAILPQQAPPHKVHDLNLETNTLIYSLVLKGSTFHKRLAVTVKDFLQKAVKGQVTELLPNIFL